MASRRGIGCTVAAWGAPGNSLGRTCGAGVTGVPAADSPLRHAAGPAGEVIVIAVADVRDALEACREPAADLVLPRKAPPPGIGPRGAVLGGDRCEQVDAGRFLLDGH